MTNDKCKYVNVFQGNGEIDLPKPEGIAATWLFPKAQCGNTYPGSALPFGKMTCGPYSGGYPTGYGNHLPNSCGGVLKFSDRIYFKGFSHIHHSGTGGIGMYYNFAVTTPLYGELRDISVPMYDETACPGYYSVTVNNMKCETTVSENVAYHRYSFDGKGTVMIDFSNDGLLKSMQNRFSFSEKSKLTIISNNKMCAEIIVQGVKLYFYVECTGDVKASYLWKDYTRTDRSGLQLDKTMEKFGGAFDVLGTCVIKLSISFRSIKNARNFVDEAKDSFDIVKMKASEIWEEYLGRIQIETKSDELKEIFYSNLYHTLIKPCNWNGESFLYDSGDFYCDFTTFWDIYKTQLPLVFTLYKKEMDGILNTFINLGNELGYLPVNLTISTDMEVAALQARMLIEHSMADAYYRGMYDGKKIIHAAYKDVMHISNQDYVTTGYCERYTHILDMAEACQAMGKISREVGETGLAEEFFRLAKHWRNAFDKNTGLMSDHSNYYEGDLWNYSFRLMHDMEERISLAGGKEKFVELLDYFFGYTREAVKQVVKADDFEFIENIDYHSFEGFNNEPDMETPYAYIFADRHDRTCEIVRACTTYMFTAGKGGMPGNNDSGALSSCYIWNMLGVFPVTGQDLMLIGSPGIDGATLRLSNNNEFRIIAHNNSDKNVYVEKAVLNGRVLNKMMFTVGEMMNGGTLELYMKGMPGSSAGKK